MKRIEWHTPGFDCRADCQHTPKGDHGISGGRHVFAVQTDEGDVAVVLDLFGAEFPDTVPADVRARMMEDRAIDPMPSISYHAAFPTEREDVGKRGERDCRVLKPGAGCFVVAQYSDVGRWFRAVGGVSGRVQSEEVWLALEAMLASRVEEIRGNDARKKWMVCPCCEGQAFVPVGPGLTKEG